MKLRRAPWIDVMPPRFTYHDDKRFGICCDIIVPPGVLVVNVVA